MRLTFVTWSFALVGHIDIEDDETDDITESCIPHRDPNQPVRLRTPNHLLKTADLVGWRSSFMLRKVLKRKLGGSRQHVPWKMRVQCISCKMLN